MRLLIERVPNHWIVELATSSSHDEVKYARAGTFSFVSEPGAQVEAKIESLDNKNATETTQAPRRKGLRRHIRRFLSYLTLSDFRPSRALESWPADPPKMFSEDSYDSFAHGGSTWNQSGYPGFYEEMTACKSAQELPYNNCPTPLEMDGDPVCEMDGNEEMSTKASLSLDTAHSFMNPALITAPAPDVDALPHLSPQTTPTTDSPVSSLTPSTIQSAITPPQFTGDVLDQSMSPDGVTVHQKSRYNIQTAQLQATHTTQSIFYPVSTMPYGSGEECSEAQHMDSTAYAPPEYHSTIQPLPQAPTTPFVLSDGIQQQPVVFPNMDMFGLDHTAAAAAGRHLHNEWSSRTDNTLHDDSSYNVGVRDVPRVRPDWRQWNDQPASLPPVAPLLTPSVRVYKPVKCLECLKEFTGKWGLGNMRRHLRHSHRMNPQHTDRLTCHECGNTYKRSDALRKHSCQRL